MMVWLTVAVISAAWVHSHLRPMVADPSFAEPMISLAEGTLEFSPPLHPVPDQVNFDVPRGFSTHYILGNNHSTRVMNLSGAPAAAPTHRPCTPPVRQFSFWEFEAAYFQCPVHIELRNRFHLRLPLVTLAIPFVLLAARSLARTGRQKIRLRRGLCVKCGYNLVGNTSGVCPECGTPGTR
jgi:hypothetical protein